MVQWLGLCAFTAEGTSSAPGQGTKILHASTTQQKKKSLGGRESLLCRYLRHKRGTGKAQAWGEVFRFEGPEVPSQMILEIFTF